MIWLNTYSLKNGRKVDLTHRILLTLSCICLIFSFFGPVVVLAEDSTLVGTTVSEDATQPGYCSKYEADPEAVFMEDSFDRETFIGTASTTQLGIPMDYLLVHPGTGLEARKGELFDIVAFTPKVWYSHHPTESTIYVAISRGLPVNQEVASSTPDSTHPKQPLKIKKGDDYVVTGTFIKVASSSAWAMAEPLEKLTPDTQATRIILNSPCNFPVKVTDELYGKLGKPLVSFDRHEFTRTLGLGMSGNDVRELNILLGVHGRYPGATSTSTSTAQEFTDSMYFGKKTRTSLIKYQEANAKDIDIRVATGFFGEKTLNYVNDKEKTSLKNELSCALPTFAKASSTTGILYDLIAADEALVSGDFAYSSSTLPDKTIDLDLNFIVDSISSSTPEVLRSAKKAIVAKTASLDMPLSQIKVGSSTLFIPYDNVKDFSNFIGRNSISRGKISRISYYSEEVPLYFPNTIACGRILR